MLRQLSQGIRTASLLARTAGSLAFLLALFLCARGCYGTWNEASAEIDATKQQR